MDVKQLTGLKKRQQIASANKLIFLWVIGAAVAISICGVAMQFLFRQAAFNQKVITEKAKTQTTLAHNITNAKELKTKIQNLLADGNLAKVKASPDDTTLKVVLDALPTTDDKAALASSLQQQILPKSGSTLTALTTISQSDGTLSDPTAVAPSGGAQSATFDFGTSGSYDQVKNMLLDLERTIRPMNVTTLSLQGSDNALTSTVQGVTYYLPERTVELGKKTIKP